MPFTELAAVRAAYEKARRDALRAIGAAEDVKALDAVAAELAAKPAGTWRHFDIEDIRKAVEERKRAFELAAERALEEKQQAEYRARLAASYEADLEAWVRGESARQWFRDVRLRVRGDRVETSTGQSASVASVRRVLPVVLRRRQSFGPVTNLMVDSFPVEEQSPDGVKVGCTWVPWAEVDRLPKMLEAAP